MDATRRAETDRPSGGQLLSAISNTVVRVIADYAGRGPTGARTTISGDWIFVTVADALTKGERKLVEIGQEEFVLNTRKAFQGAMRDELVREVERLTGRRIVAFLSDNHIKPDVGLEAMLMEPEAGSDGAWVQSTA
jgi:uncharacterized protein YbcI